LKKRLTVTIAICTHHRPDDLVKAMQSIEDQTQPPDEVIIVDNGCQDAIKALVNSIMPNARYVPESLPGLDFARNRAICETNSEILAFLDDDAIADPNWIFSIRNAFSNTNVSALTGLILPLELETKAQQLFEKNGGFGRGFEQRIVPKTPGNRAHHVFSALVNTFSIGSGCNMAFKASVLKKLNGFDVALDAGAYLPGGGDLDMFYRTMRNGYRIIYEPKAMVLHRHRRSMQTLKKQLSGHQRSVIAFLTKAIFLESLDGRAAVLAFLGWRLIKPILRIMKRSIGQDVLPAVLLIDMLKSSWLGLGSYYASRSRAQRLENAR
jgi:GT2 family glycosyltransferase